MGYKPIPAPGFKLISGKRNPPKGDGTRRYWVQFRNGFCDEGCTYPAHTERGQPVRWKWGKKSDDWDIVAVKEES